MQSLPPSEPWRLPFVSPRCVHVHVHVLFNVALCRSLGALERGCLWASGAAFCRLKEEVRVRNGSPSKGCSDSFTARLQPLSLTPAHLLSILLFLCSCLVLFSLLFNPSSLLSFPSSCLTFSPLSALSGASLSQSSSDYSSSLFVRSLSLSTRSKQVTKMMLWARGALQQRLVCLYLMYIRRGGCLPWTQEFICTAPSNRRAHKRNMSENKKT